MHSSCGAITDAVTLVIGASAHSNWVVVAVTVDSGVTGYGEATLDGYTDQVVAHAKAVCSQAIGQDASVLRRWPSHASALGLVGAAVASALDQAYWDILGRALNAPVAQVLGATFGSVPLYANINRSLQGNRTAESFAAAAGAATRAGYAAVKCAPFDGLQREPLEAPETRAAFEAGLERVDAMRRAVGPDVALLIDCHWRFDVRTARIALRELDRFDPYWIEAPISEGDPDSWRTLRRHTDRLLAGGEMLPSARAYADFIDRSGVDVVMPDVRYAGGISGLRRVGEYALMRGVRVAPHNPAGPVATMASAHVARALEAFLILEFPWGETTVGSRISDCGSDMNGPEIVIGSRPGLGIDINQSGVSDLPQRQTLRTVEPELLER